MIKKLLATALIFGSTSTLAFAENEVDKPVLEILDSGRLGRYVDYEIGVVCYVTRRSALSCIPFSALDKKVVQDLNEKRFLELIEKLKKKESK